MFKSKTVFVIGAGASAEAGLPIGSDLTNDIANLINFKLNVFQEVERGDPQIVQCIREVIRQDPLGFRDSNFIGTSANMRTAMGLAASIDNYMEAHKTNREVELIGKLAIAKAIINAERNSIMSYGGDSNAEPFEIRNVSGTWYRALAQLLFEGLELRDADKVFANTAFIVFNYDRCLEHFLQRAISVYYRISSLEAAQLVARADIVHPYGKIGDLFATQADELAFGSELINLTKAAAQIKTFSERIDDDPFLTRIRHLIAESQTTIFLGFAFHHSNIDLLTPGQAPERSRRVFATTYGVSASDTSVIKDNISQMFRGRPMRDRPEAGWQVETFSGKCRDMFAEYWRSLSA